jgi:hypothetical protein
MARDRGHNLLSLVALSLAVICVGAAVWVASVAGPSGAAAAGAPGRTDAVRWGDDLVLDFTGRSATAALQWRVEGKTDCVRRTARGLLVVSRTADDPPRIVLDLDAPEESFGALELTMALNKGARGKVWGSRYAGERPTDDRCRWFALEPGLGLRTYRVELGRGEGRGEGRGAPLSSMTIQLTDAPVRAVVRRIRLLRTAGWQSYAACGAGHEDTVEIGGVGVSAVPAPVSGVLGLEVDVPANRPLLHLATAIHPLQKILGRPETMFRVQVQPLDGMESNGEQTEPVFQRLVDPTAAAQRRWFFDEADLSPWAGRRVTLELETLSWRRENDGPERLLPGHPSWALPLWGPLLITGGAGEAAPPPAGIVLLLIEGVGQSEFGCYGDPGGFPAVSRHFGRAVALRDAYMVEYDRNRFLRTLFQAEYLHPETGQEGPVPGQSLVSRLRGQGFRTAAFYNGGAADNLLRDRSLQAGFEFIGRGDLELGLPPISEDERSLPNPLLDHPGPLSWLGQLGREPFFLLVHLDGGGSKIAARGERLEAVDRAVGRLAACLAATGHLDETVFCLAGLRGQVRETRVDRGCRLWDEAALIPMLVTAPGGLCGVAGPGRIFRSIDILPTLFELAGAELDHVEAEGHSVAPWLRGAGSGEWPVEEVFLSQQRAGRRYLGLRRGPLKLIWRTEPRALAACYDLDLDPGERTDISPAGPFNRPLFGAEPLGPERYADMVRRLESHFGPYDYRK